MNTPQIIQHIERNLERIPSEGTGTTIEVDGSKIHLLKFFDQPIPSVITICTCGLSKHTFGGSKGGVRQEILLGYFSTYESDQWYALIAAICEDLLATHKALEIGQVYDVPGSLFPNTEISGLYCSFPAFYGDDIWVCDGTNPGTYFIWLFPVTNKEVNYIKEFGAESFEEDMIMVQQPRLFDFARESMKV